MILIVVEHANGKVSKSTWEMVTAARELAQAPPAKGKRHSRRCSSPRLKRRRP